MRLTAITLAATAGAVALIGAASTSAQQPGASLQLAGVPATLALSGSFTMTVSGSTGAASPASIYEIYGPAPCQSSVDAQLEASPVESLLSPEAEEPAASGLEGTFTVRAHGLGEAVSGPGVYSVCVFMEAPEEPESEDGSEEESVIAVASARFVVLAGSTGRSAGATLPDAVRGCVAAPIKGSQRSSVGEAIARTHCWPPPRCIVPHIRGRRQRSAERAIAAAHCAVGDVRRVGSRHVRRGRVVWQSRRAGRSLPRGTRVGFVVSAGASRGPKHNRR
jgi:hypothetical protein